MPRHITRLPFAIARDSIPLFDVKETWQEQQCQDENTELGCAKLCDNHNLPYRVIAQRWCWIEKSNTSMRCA